MRIHTTETADIKRQVLKFEKARNNLLAVIAFTVVNIILTAFDASINFLFSATLPQVIFQISKDLGPEMGSNIFMITGLIIALITIIPYFIFWILSKRARGLILAALIYFGIDSFLLLVLILDMDFNASFLLEIAFHCWILYYLINGVTAWFKLRDVNRDDFKAILQAIKSNNTIATVSSVSDNSGSKKEIFEEDKSAND
jgi:hypothetical protein